MDTVNLDQLIEALEYFPEPTRYHGLWICADDVDDTVLLPVAGYVLTVFADYGLLELRRGVSRKVLRKDLAERALLLDEARLQARSIKGIPVTPIHAVLVGSRIGNDTGSPHRIFGLAWEAEQWRPADSAHYRAMKQILLPLELDVSRSAIHTARHESESVGVGGKPAGGVWRGAVHGDGSAAPEPGRERRSHDERRSGRRGWFRRGRFRRQLLQPRRDIQWRCGWHWLRSG